MAFRKKHDITDIYRVRGKTGEESRLPELDTSIARNRNYHNYFRGYTEIQRKDEKGRIRIERYYTKPWIVSGLSVRKYWLLRLLYVLLTVLSRRSILCPWFRTCRGPATGWSPSRNAVHNSPVFTGGGMRSVCHRSQR